MQAIFIGGSLDGQTLDVPDGLQSYDVIAGDFKVGYCKRINAFPTGVSLVFFVLATLSEAEMQSGIRPHVHRFLDNQLQSNSLQPQ